MGDLASGDGAPGERDLADVGMCSDCMADGGSFDGGLISKVIMIVDGERTVSIDDVDDTWGESSVVYQAGELECCERGEFGGLVGCHFRRLERHIE